ncbi:DEAD/DEAH box helicase [Brochothrix thermosphacta]|uniref:Protein translocase subunit SecA n=1 Tax=Brochothrix thermosphacta TaxID=2756 RepID=A0A1D2LN33_BROTH|nr:DEAD/DEAH box helicase [Brochothrix thermosphacta]ATF25592.1 preprotein translocase subunit SecA [Brochothrix thermosphacta]ATH84926.1 preprotein translocase subunit SecA [Brochothrix thermosphacta]ODJ64272.1 preprotein translocase subunit SecA [Brochothrix thermosphacta]ODJ71378.1 preprotein translocase subunit SecA [Brochothrix thermosphacta]ODJ72054.1 preprotein translocase subunit SecA [Brochothrix thermosphacta]
MNIGKHNKQMTEYRRLARRVLKQSKLYTYFDDSEFSEQTAFWRIKYKEGQPLTEDDLVKSFALLREAIHRVIGFEAAYVQLIGALALEDGCIAEMKTGEGKTLVSLFVLYSEVLKGNKVHLMTANTYLAERDREEIGRILEFMGLTVTLNIAEASIGEKKAIYEGDVIYGTASEFGFDYLRDNMIKNNEDCVQTGLDFVLLDEADSILIDEARTPLIISSTKTEDLSLYQRANRLLSTFNQSDYNFDEIHHTVWLSENGIEKSEYFWQVKDLFSSENQHLIRATMTALRAHILMKKDKNYVVMDGKVVIVDENTGRAIPGRRYNDGIHQALEAKESVEINYESTTLATITIQNYFRMYQKVSGMTGTASTEAEEFHNIYNLDVVVIPTNMRINRKDKAEEIYRTREEQGKAIVQEVYHNLKEGRPSLVGTNSIQDSEWLGELLNIEGIPYNILNAKNHRLEAAIISKAGTVGTVTIATNMAGRGTDIKLDQASLTRGGLCVIGASRFDSRRIDLQLIGRSGRRGDPGYSKFILSLEDELLKQFDSKRWERYKLKKRELTYQPLKGKFIKKLMRNAQEAMEAHNFDVRKQLLQYDEILHVQSQTVYAERRKILDMTTTKAFTEAIMEEILTTIFIKEKTDEAKKVAIFDLFDGIALPLPVDELVDMGKREGVTFMLKWYNENRLRFNAYSINQMEREMFIETIDEQWIDYLYQVEAIKEGIGLRAYGQIDPLVTFQRETNILYNRFIEACNAAYVTKILTLPVPSSPAETTLALDINEVKRVMKELGIEADSEEESIRMLHESYNKK